MAGVGVAGKGVVEFEGAGVDVAECLWIKLTGSNAEFGELLPVSLSLKEE